MRIEGTEHLRIETYEEGDHSRSSREEAATEEMPLAESQEPFGSTVAPRAVWKGSISFGMVMIPVKLYSAIASKDIGFHLLHKTCGTRLKNLRWCPVDEEAVPWEDVVRGYEYAPDKHVIMTEEDFESIPIPSKRIIDLSTFVPIGEIDPIYFEKSYYLTPEPPAEKPFAMLSTVMEQRQLAAIGKISIRERERLCALRPLDGTLGLETLFYEDEIRERRGGVTAVNVSDREMDMAYQLIDFLTDDFRPSEYRDESREALQKVIDAKLEGRQIERPREEPGGKVIDLMDALRASLELARLHRAGTPR